MKFWQLILVLFISFIVGFSTNVFYENFKLKGPNEDQAKFTAFLDEYWEYVIDQNPTFASLLGYEGYDDKVSSNSISELYKNRDFEKYVIDVLEKIIKGKKQNKNIITIKNSLLEKIEKKED